MISRLLKWIWKNFISSISAFVVIANLGFWMFPIFFLAAARKIAGDRKRAKNAVIRCINFVYILAVDINSLWMARVIGVKLVIKGEMPEHLSPIIVSNHQTWFDIPILQGLIRNQGTITKFLVKRELAWLPIVGWICYALGFPRLFRGKGTDSRKKDLAAIRSVSSELTQEPGALLIFAEGTRFTEKKLREQNNPYQCLLSPKPGGLATALENVPSQTPVVDITISYPSKDTNFWGCLSGVNKEIDLYVKCFKAEEISDPRLWLEKQWNEKDFLLSSSHK